MPVFRKHAPTFAKAEFILSLSKERAGLPDEFQQYPLGIFLLFTRMLSIMIW